MLVAAGLRGGAQGSRQRAPTEAVGEDLACAGLAGGNRVSSTSPGLTADLDALGFQETRRLRLHHLHRKQLGPLDDAIVDAIEDNKLVGAAVISGNRNFEGRVHANVRANYLASPPLVVAYALLGKVTVDITTEPLGTGSDGQPVYLKDVWPTNQEIADVIGSCLSREQFLARYGEVFKGPRQWQSIEVDTDSDTYRWSDGSTYVKNPPYFEGITMNPPPVTDVHGARILAELGDSITTDHISPAGSIRHTSPSRRRIPAGAAGDAQANFNSWPLARGAAIMRS